VRLQPAIAPDDNALLIDNIITAVKLAWAIHYSLANLSSAVFSVESSLAKQKRTTRWSKPLP